MVGNDLELDTALKRISWFQKQVIQMRATETNAANYKAAGSGFLAEVDRMRLEVREYLSVLPNERVGAA